MKILLTGGGTAGHVMPHIAMMNLYRKYFSSISYIGAPKSMEQSLMAPYKDVAFFCINPTKLVRGKLFVNLLIPFRLLKSIKEAKKILKQERPDIVFSKGGFVALPVVIAAKKLGIKVVAHESDLEMGLANKLTRRRVDKLLTTFEKTSENIKNGVFVGSAMREDMFLPKATARERLGLKTSKPVLVITGGSLGAMAINDAAWADLDRLTDNFYVLHLVGKGNKRKDLESKPRYRQIEFADNMGTILSAADLVVSRAGSNTIYELAAMKKPMLLIPLPKGASRGDQVDNATYFFEKGYADYIPQEELKKRKFTDLVLQTYAKSGVLSKNLIKADLKPANEKIIKILVSEAKAGQDKMHKNA